MSTDLKSIREQLRQYAESEGYVSDREWTDLEASGVNSVEVEIPADGDNTKSVQVNLQELLNKLKNISGAEPPAPNSPEHLESLVAQLKGVYEEFIKTRTELTQAGLEDADKARLIAKQELLQAHLQGALQTATAVAHESGQMDKLERGWFEAAGMSVPEGGGSGEDGQFTVNSRAQTTGRGEQAQGGQGAGAGKAQTVQFPTLKAQISGGAQFSTDAYMQTLSLDNAVLNIYDDIQQNSKRGKELVMLFAYFAQRAASGDMGAMFQFMRFLTYIISKDKAKQNIDLGKKLIQLQDDSRRATNKLLNASFDPNDPNSSFEQSKLLTSVKSETDAIATSQKLISQSMEEFGVVIETLTGLEKNALETWKRVMQKLSA